MPARGHHVVVGDDDRWCFEIPPAAFAQVADIVVLDFGQIQPDKFEIIFTNSAQQVVYLVCL